MEAVLDTAGYLHVGGKAYPAYETTDGLVAALIGEQWHYFRADDSSPGKYRLTGTTLTLDRDATRMSRPTDLPDVARSYDVDSRLWLEPFADEYEMAASTAEWGGYLAGGCVGEVVMGGQRDKDGNQTIPGKYYVMVNRPADDGTAQWFTASGPANSWDELSSIIQQLAREQRQERKPSIRI